jgi:hypothetical protein
VEKEGLERVNAHNSIFISLCSVPPLTTPVGDCVCARARAQFPTRSLDLMVIMALVCRPHSARG